MRIFVAILFLGLIVVVGSQIYSFVVRQNDAGKEFAEMEAKLNRARADQDKLRAELDYYLHPENLEKELRKRFNYKEPGENLLILVPQNATTASDIEN